MFSRSTAESLRNPWFFFDRIYCISLVNRHDRRQQALKEFTAVGLEGRVEFILVQPHAQNRAQGIFESHILCLRRGIAANASNILIFEDDVFFKNFSPERLRQGCICLARNGRWDALFLGCITSSSRPAGQHIARIKYRCLSHAYAVSAEFARELVTNKWTGVPWDTFLRHQQKRKRFFALTPMCALQGLAGSDNQTIVIHRLRRLFGGLPFLQQLNEFYQCRKLLLLTTNLLALFAASLLLWRYFL